MASEYTMIRVRKSLLPELRKFKAKMSAVLDGVPVPADMVIEWMMDFVDTRMKAASPLEREQMMTPLGVKLAGRRLLQDQARMTRGRERAERLAAAREVTSEIREGGCQDALSEDVQARCGDPVVAICSVRGCMTPVCVRHAHTVDDATRCSKCVEDGGAIAQVGV